MSSSRDSSLSPPAKQKCKRKATNIKATKQKPPGGLGTKNRKLLTPGSTGDTEKNVDESSSDEGGSQNEDQMNVSITEEPGGFKFGDIYIPPPPQPACHRVETGPRLIITHIENIDFKSYAGKQVLGPLHKSFTSIIGPNGSGKSNVIDSMLFVFGYRAAKIRSKKLSVLLHKSQQRQNVKSCTVTVHFQEIIDKPGEDFDVVPNSSFHISRTAHFDSSSFYTVNGRRVQFKEVSKLLLGHGIDLDHNRFLILQGEVEQISMMKPMAPSEHECGMLEYLEDIIGTTRYKTPLETLFGRVEKLTEERSDKIERVKIAEKEKDSLEGPKNEAVAYLKAENDKTIYNNFMLQKYINEHKPKIEEKKQKRKEIEDQMAAFKEEMKKVVEEREELNSKIKEESKSMESTMQKKEKAKASFDAMNTRDVEINADIVVVSKNRKKTKDLVANEKKKLIDLENVPEKNAKDIKELDVRLQDLMSSQQKEEAAKDKLLENIAVETKGLQESKEKLETQLVVLKKTVDETNSANCITKKELDIYLQDEQRQRTKLEQMQANYKATSELAASRKNEIKELEKNIPVIEAQLQEAKQELEQVLMESANVNQKVREQREKVEETRSSMQATRSKGKVLDFLMNQKQQGNLPGIYGRLGDLGGIDQKYDIAVSTACGPLDHIVVDTKETGERCLELLRKHDVGRVNIIILDKQEHLRPKCETKMKYPEGVPRLFDLIKVQDKRISPAFYFGVRETLVANDMNQATRIAYGSTRYRVVCLTGEMVETSGTMSGGGRPSKGRMGQSVVSTNVATPGQVEKMAKQLDQLESRARQLRERQDTLQPLVNQLPQQLKKMHIDLKKFTAEIKSAVENEPGLKEQVKKQEEKLKAAAPNPAEVKRMEAAIAKTQAAYDKAAEAAEKVNAEVKKLHKQIVEKTGGKIQAAQKKLDDINKSIDKVRKEKTKLTVAITTSKRDVKKTTEKIANMEQEIKDAEVKLTNMQEEIKKITVDARELVDKIEKYSSLILEQEQVIATLKEQLRKIAEKEQAKKATKLEIDHLLEGTNKIVQEFESRVRSLTKNLKALKINRIPGEDSVPELKEYSAEELEAETPENLQYKLSLAETVLASKKPDFSAVEEYFEREAVYMRRLKELEELTTQRNEMRAIVEDLRKRRLDEFMLGFNIITDKLKEMYQMITLGGDAELELVDSLDPFREGIIFSVRPPKKSWKNISNLSGGEKTLSSLALVFALHYYKPSPLYVMDEIDAALDFKNVSIVGNYIKERTKNAQFIIISLRANMFELADRLVGIYKTHNATKSCTINPRFYGKQAVKTTQSRDQQIQMEKTQPVVVQMVVENPMEQSDNNKDDVEKEKSSVPSSLCIESIGQGEPLDVGVLVEKPMNNL